MTSTKRDEDLNLLPSSPTSICTSTTSTIHTSPPPASPVNTTVKWAQKRSQKGKGVVMRADVENQNQKKPLIRGEKKKEVRQEELEKVVKCDDRDELNRLLEWKGRQAVLRPVPSQTSVHNNALHLAVENDAQQCLALLLNPCPQVHILDAPNHDGMTPLLLAVRRGRKPGIVKLLLDNGANANARDDNGYTPLHFLVYLLKNKRDPADVKALLDMTVHLLDQNSIDLEPHAKLTPLADAVCKITEDDSLNQGLLSYCKILVQHGASLQEMTSEGSVKQILERNQALASEVLAVHSPSPPQRPAASCFLDLIANNTSSEDDLKKFLRSKNDYETEAASNSFLGQHSVLYMAVDACNEVRVQTLLDHKADAKREEPTGSLPLHRAAERGHLPIFNLLLLNMKGKTPKVDLTDNTMSLIQKLMENWKRNTGHGDCFDRLLEADVELNVNQEHIGHTPIHVAAAFNKQEAVMKLLQRGAFLGARPWLRINEVQTPSVLPSIKASTLEQAMDGCIKHLPHSDTQQESEDLNNDEYTLLLDYRFLLPPDAASQDVSEVSTLMEISSSKQHRRVIKHPLVQTLLYAKWRKALPFYFVNLFFYFLFVTLLTAFVYSLKDLRLLEADNESSDQKEAIDNLSHRVTGIKIVLLPLTLYMLVREVVQIFFSRIQYLKNIENYLELLLVVLVFILCFANLGIVWTRHLAAWAMIVAWYEFVLILGRAPPLALYITMLRHVSWNFLKFILLFGALILAFTISFNMLLQQPKTGQEGDKEFQDFGSTLPKAIVMSTGEFEYSSLRNHFSNNSFAMASTVIMFLIFLFLIFLVLMNVMNALAISDTQEVVDDAELFSLMSRLELVYLIEAVLLWCLSKCYISFLKSRLGRLQLLSSSRNSCKLLTKINRTDKKRRLLAGKITEEWKKNIEENLSLSKLDDTTARCLRNHRVAYLEGLEAEEREDRLNAMLRMENLLRRLVAENPEDLKKSLAGVQFGH